MFAKALLLASLALAPVIAPTHAAPASRATTCSDYVLVSTRGTGELQGPSIAFVSMIAQTLSSVPGGVEFDTIYPASISTQDLGTAALIAYLTSQTAACPSQKYLLLGYSQGALSTAGALTHFSDPTGAIYKAIVGVLVVGNPSHHAFETVNVDQVGGKSTDADSGIIYGVPGIAIIPDVWYASGKLIDICYINDIVCNGLTPGAVAAAGGPHLLYGATPSVQTIGANFLIGQLGK